MHERIDWRTAPPLWRPALAGATDLDRPALLRFAGDDFMDELQTRLHDERPDLSPVVAAPETWRDEGVGLGGDGASAPVKLYQPVHSRYYVVGAGLVCGKYGLPDRPIDPGAGESSFFVLRRLEPVSDQQPVDPRVTATFHEYAWVTGQAGPGWQPVDGGGLATHEDRLPLFPVNYPSGDRRRRLLAGLVPVSAREAYEAGNRLPLPPPSDPDDPDLLAVLADERLALLDPVVAGIASIRRAARDIQDLGLPDEQREARTRELHVALVFALLDLDDYLTELVRFGEDADDADEVRELLDGQGFPPTSAATWLDAVEAAADARAGVVDGTGQPPELVTALGLAGIVAAVTSLLGAADVEPVATAFFLAVTSAFGVDPTDTQEPDPGDEDEVGDDEQPVAGRTAGAVYVVRCAYERPHCPPSHRVVLSHPSAPFELASFFDPDAPYRPVRIAMPVDTSPAGLRNFPKNVSVAISQQLRQQLQRVQDIKLSDLDDGDIGDEQTCDFGMLCTLSIPIITICALILLMIIVSLLNIVFFWVPLFKICRPKVG